MGSVPILAGARESPLSSAETKFSVNAPATASAQWKRASSHVLYGYHLQDNSPGTPHTERSSLSVPTGLVIVFLFQSLLNRLDKPTYNKRISCEK